MQSATARGRSRPWIWWALVCIYVLVIFALSTRSRLRPPLAFPMSDKVAHLGEYTVLGFLVQRAAGASWPAGGLRQVWRIAAVIACGLLIGAGDELLQSLVPGRVSSIWDLAADGLGLALGLAIDRLLHRWQSGARGEAA